jgi:Subtilase family
MKNVILLCFCLCSLMLFAQKPAGKLSNDLLRLIPGNVPPQLIEGDETVHDQIIYDANGNVVVRLLAKTGSEVLVNELRAKSFTIVAITKFTVTVSVPVSRIKELENVQELRKATAEYKPGHGAVVSQGDTAMKSHLARVTYGVNGAGVKVGVLSDSYNNLGGAATGVTNGELPGPGNPNGFTTPVEVLEDLSGGGSDEGRAMVEIVHDVAPGATKAFATAFVGGEAGFANNIIALKDATCRVIVDDVFYFAEPFFQNGVIAQAVNTVKAAGVAYFSSAGNHARTAYANPFRAGSFTFPGVPYLSGNVPAHNFAASGDPDVYMLQLTGLAVGRTYTIVLQWDEPFPSVSGGAGAQTDMDMYWYNADGTALSASAGAAATDNLGGDPIEQLQVAPGGSTRNIAIQHYAGPAPQNLRVVIYTNGLPLTFGNTAVPGINASTLVGHANTEGAIAMGAAPWFRTPAYGVNPPVIESFSSLGGTPILFDDAGNRLPVPIIYSKPEITGPDAGNTSFFTSDISQDTDTFPNFFGTSASAPHAAAVAALMIQLRNGAPPLTPDQVKTFMENSTIDMDDPDIAGFQTGFDYRTGHGLLQADLALALVNCMDPVTLTTGVIPNICEGTKSFTIPYTATTGDPISYSISGPGITSVNDAAFTAAPSSITVNLVGNATLPSIAYNLQLKNANGCFSDTIKGTITVDPAALVNAGPDQTVCDSDTIYLSATLSGVATNMVWQLNAAFGNFVGPDTQPNAKFVLNAAGKLLDSLSFGAMTNDPGGNVCQGGLDTVKIYIQHGATVEAGPNQSLCATAPVATLAGSKGGTATVATWSGGAGTFTPNNTTLNATYTPTPGEITAGSVKLKLTTDDPTGICKAAVDSVIITYDPAALINAGSDQAVCDSDTIVLNATLSGLATNMVWQKNVAFGTFITPDTEPIAKFVLNAAGKLLDSLSFGAMTNDPGANVCQGGLDTVKIYILHPAVPVVAADDTIFAGTSINLTATGCTGPGFTLRWYQSADDAPVSMPVSPLVTTAYYARCEQTRIGASCLSDKSTLITVTVLPGVIYVNVANNAPGQDGSSWSKAFSSLQQGLSAAETLHASAGTAQVWVAQGTYKPGTLRKDVFAIPSGVKVYGGFVGTETQISERNWKTNLTILSGEIGTNALNDNTYHVVIFRATNETTQLDGFQILRGFAEFFVGNQNTNLNDPGVQASGGGVLAIDKSKGLIINCTLTDNRATAGGGMLLRDSSHLHITQSIIFGNEATFGGGVYLLGGSKPYFENVLFAINKGLGGALYVNNSQPELMNCTIASNKDGSNNVGGIFNTNATTTVRNSIMWGNTPLQSTAGSNITNSIVEGGYAGAGNLSLNPLFVNPNPVGLAPMGVLGDYHLQACSPAINSGTNAGAPNVDLDGNARPFPVGIGIADMGVYESQSTGSSGPNNLTVTEPITSGTVLKVAGKITATNQISGATVVYQATQAVTLSPGFSATGNSFLALIGDCSTPVPAGIGSGESFNQK